MRPGEARQLSANPGIPIAFEPLPPGLGRIDAFGVYHAPGMIPRDFVVTLTARAADGTPRSATVRILLRSDAEGESGSTDR